MNIFRPQVPYVFRPPRQSPVLGSLLAELSRRFYLQRRFHVSEVEVQGAEAVKDCVRRGLPVLIAPNHADHADPHVLLQAARHCGSRFYFMAAREGFESSVLNRWVLQRMGAFSVDREGTDLSAVKTAIQLLQAGKNPLVIFPEGEIWHHHERLDEVNEGVATILLKAYGRVQPERDAVLIPTALRYRHEPEIEQSFSQRCSRLERSINWAPRPDLPTLDRIYRLGAGLLATKEVEFLGRTLNGSLAERLLRFQTALVEEVERELQIPAPVSEKAIPGRVKELRRQIRKELIEGRVHMKAEETARYYEALDRLYLAIQLYSYPTNYLSEDPSVDRLAETLLKLEEDVLGKGYYPARRRVRVRFLPPISVKAFLDGQALDVRRAPGPLTARLAAEIQQALV